MAVEIRNVTKQFGKQKALDHVNFVINKGELVGFLGPNGAGKSTMMKIINGYLAPDKGEVLVDGIKVNPDNQNVKKRIGYLPEQNPLYLDLYVRESLEITAGFYRLPRIRERVEKMIEITGLREEAHKTIRELSKGYRQRVGLAQALIHDPDILILDEPTTGLDPNQLEEIRELIREVGKEKTVILSSHIMQEVEAVCSRVIIIKKGKIVADDSIEQVKKAAVQSTQLVFVGFDKSVEERELMGISGVGSAKAAGSLWELEAESSADIRPAIFRFAVENGLVLLTMQEKQQNLEGIFQELTQ